MPHDGKFKWCTVIAASGRGGGGRILEVLGKLFWEGSWVAWNFRRFYIIFMTKFLKFYSTSPTPVCIYGMFIDIKYRILQANELTIIFLSPYQGKRWCYVGVSGSMPSSCPDVKTSTRYPGFTWSYMACTIPKKEKCYEAYRKQEVSNLTINCFSEQTFWFPQIFGTILWQQWWGVTSHVGI